MKACFCAGGYELLNKLNKKEAESIIETASNFFVHS